MAVPEGGFGKQLDAMHEWHRAQGIQPRHGRGRHEDDRDFVRWCFAADTARIAEGVARFARFHTR